MNIPQFFKDARSIWVGFLSIVAAVAWAGDSRYMLKEDSDKMISIMEVRSLNQRNQELEIQIRFEPDDQRIRMFKAMKDINKSKIQSIIDEKQISGE